MPEPPVGGVPGVRPPSYTAMSPPCVESSGWGDQRGLSAIVPLAVAVHLNQTSLFMAIDAPVHVMGELSEVTSVAEVVVKTGITPGPARVAAVELVQLLSGGKMAKESR